MNVRLKRIKWLGPGVLITQVSGQVKNVFPGEVGELEPARGEMLINQGLATDPNIRVKIELDPEFPPPSRREREEMDRQTQLYYGVTANIVRQRRLHPHGEYVELIPVPIEGDL